jgi:hypothetical protein
VRRLGSSGRCLTATVALGIPEGVPRLPGGTRTQREETDMRGRQLSFVPETPDEDGDQLDLIEEAAKASGPLDWPEGDVHIVEARCLRCGGTCNPTDADDTEHAFRDDGRECGGRLEVIGTWGMTEAAR